MKSHITNIISRLFFRFSIAKFPRFLQYIINLIYMKIFRLNLDEFKPISSYKSLNELFTRSLVKDRDFDKSKSTFISPSDSLITECGLLQKDRLLQIKSMEYSIDDLLDSKFGHLDDIYDGLFINFYLSPKDYHHYHSLNECVVKKVVHIPGKLYPVNIPCLNKKKELFVENERVILECLFAHRRFFMVLIGALNVGKMTLNFEKNLQTNISLDCKTVYEYEDGIFLNKGEDIGHFMMGSTVVLIMPKDMAKLSVASGDVVKFGDVIAKTL